MLHYCCLCRVETIIDVSSLMISGLPKHLPDCQGRERLQQKFNLLRRECCGPEVILFLALKYIFSSVMSQNILTKSKSAVRIKKTNNYRVIEEYLVRVCWQLNRMEKKKPDVRHQLCWQEEIVAMCQISREYNRCPTFFPFFSLRFHVCVGRRRLPLLSNACWVCRFLTEKMTSGQHGDPHMLSDNGNAFNGDHYNRSLHEVVGFYIRLEVSVFVSLFSLAHTCSRQDTVFPGVLHVRKCRARDKDQRAGRFSDWLHGG